MKPWQTVALGICLGLLAAGAILFVSSQPQGTPLKISTPLPPPGLVVHVDGAVKYPGVYTLPKNSRIRDAISAAGGFLDGANSLPVNLAAQLEDGAKILVPFLSDTPGWTVRTLTIPSTRFSPTLSTSQGAININIATQQEIETLPGIGETKAAAIITYRQEHGPFLKPEDLLNVPGIGPSTLLSIKNLIVLGPVSEPTSTR